MRSGLLLALLAACTDAPPPAPTTISYLTPAEHLERASMALRGIRPSLAELRTVDADPEQLPALVDRYLGSREFGATVRDLHNEVLLLRFQQPTYTMPPLQQIADKSFDEVNTSLYEEPLRLIEDIVMSDQPYTRIVTADYTMADRTGALVWGLPHSDRDQWEPTVWTDARGAAGILASTAFYLRYRTTAANYNRGRANAVASGLLCDNFLDADIHLDPTVDLSNPDVVTQAVVKDPACAACHQALDPLASYFFPFVAGTLDQSLRSYPIDYFDATQSTGWFLTNDRPPSYFGQPAVGLDGLGRAIAADPRFARCAALHFAAYLTEQDRSALDPAWIAQLQNDFVANNYSAKQLAREIVLSDRFRAGADRDPTGAVSLVGYQKVRPEQLQRMLQDLTGYVWSGYSGDPVDDWTIGPYDYLEDDYSGFRVLAGGIDSYYVTDPVHTMNATASLVARTAAGKAAEAVVAHDATAPQKTLLSDVSASDDATVRGQLAMLHGRIFGELAPDDDSLAASVALWQGAFAASHDPRRAWVITLTGMMSDLRALYY